MTRSLEDLHTPALCIDLDRVEHNLSRTLQILGGDPRRWRPHVKTSKVPEVLDLVLGRGVEHFKCATTKEARTLLSRAAGPIDLLVAMPHYGRNLRGVAALATSDRGHRLSILSEDPAHARLVRETSGRLGIFVDLDPGYHRTGIPLRDRTRIRDTILAAGDALRGLHFYDGHLHGTDPAEREAACTRIYSEFVGFVGEVAAELDLPSDRLELITSGTPTFQIAAGFAPLSAFDHKVSPGTVVYWDTTSEALGIGGYEFAVTVLARVISRPNEKRITVDGGSKALDAAIGDPCCTVDGWPGLTAQRPSEEHLPLAIDSGEAPAVGSLVRLIPRHVCPTVNLADDAVLTRGEEVIGIVPVAARGHDLA